MKKYFTRLIIFYSVLLMLGAIYSCSENSTEPKQEPTYQSGKNYYTTVVDGVTREYYVHVPTGYDDNSPTPLVLMLHGASQTGEQRYDNSGWREVGEDENILTVFPTALVYRYYTNSYDAIKTNTRWNSFPPLNYFVPGQNPKDDVKFLRQVITEMSQRFNVDSQRIYMAGFSSGARMTFRCAVEMSDLLAAVVQSGATYHVDTVFTPQRNLPISFELGNSDDTWWGNDVNMSLCLFDSALTYGQLWKTIINVHANSFSFETTYTLSGDTSSVVVATFKGIPDVRNRQFNFTFVKGLEHCYPNGINHPMNGARVHWAWMKQYSLP